MTNQEKLRRIIEEVVRKEIRAIAPGIIKEVMTQVMGNMISEAVIDTTTPSDGLNNSNKRRNLQESVAYGMDEQLEEYPTMGGRMMSQEDAPNVRGYGELRNPRMNPKNLITIDHVMTENGNPVPIPVDAIPESVLRAINKDYRPLMAELDKKKNGSF